MPRWPVATLALLLGGCELLVGTYRVEAPREITAFDSPTDARHALAVTHQVSQRIGNVHDINSLKTLTRDRTEWFYLDRLEGTVAAEAIVYKRSPSDRAGHPLRGTIRFNGGTVTLDLQTEVHRFGKAAQDWAPYRFNGTYPLKVCVSPCSPETPGRQASTL